MKTAYKIVDFFNTLDDLTADYIDSLEIEPIQINTNLYVTGLRRVAFSYTAVDVHLKEIRKIKVGDTWMLMEPDNDMWVPASIIDEDVLARAYEQVVKYFGTLQSFTIMTLQYKLKDKDMKRIETLIYDAKRKACKDALAFRKKYDQVTTKFTEFKSDGNGAFQEFVTGIHQPTDFEVLAAAVEAQ